jgi:hypothetical protein
MRGGQGPLSERVFRDMVYPVLHAGRWPLMVLVMGRGLHSSTSLLNLSRICH